ncbi:hypothetical protein V5O48_010081 [Marasmius crinis-equi]|uniref:Uncharacterized protein n=1 Tax=Marasmius crinis-equi TaxID=585013 RepID=A0ABR3F9Z1_9AGAR
MPVFAPTKMRKIKWSTNGAGFAAKVLELLKRIATTIPVPGLVLVPAVAADVLQTIDDAETNKDDLQDLADEAADSSRLREEVMESQLNPSSAERLEDYVRDLASAATEIKEVAKSKAERPRYRRLWTAKQDAVRIRGFRGQLKAKMDQFQARCHISSLVVLLRGEERLHAMENRLAAMDTKIDQLLCHSSMGSSRASFPELSASVASDQARDIVGPSNEPQIATLGRLRCT